MKYFLLFLMTCVLFIGLMSCSSKNKDDKTTSEISDLSPGENSKIEEPEIKIPSGPISVADALPMLEKWSDQTISVSAEYIGNYSSGETLTFRLMDSIESTEELECVFDISDSEDLFEIGFGPITIKGIVWNGQLVKCQIIKE
jgi:hypothetical protein